MICEPALVHQQRERDAGLFPELTGIFPIAEANYGQSRFPLTERRFMLAQLRDVLAAEDSTVVTEEDDHRRLLVPKGTQPDFVPVRIRQIDVGERRAEGCHDETPYSIGIAEAFSFSARFTVTRSLSLGSRLPLMVNT